MSGVSTLDGVGAFLGRFHPVWVHLPIGILFLLVFLELAGLASRWRRLSWLPRISEQQRTLILAAAAAAAALAGILGWLLSRSGEYDPALLARHQSLGIATALATLILLAAHRVRRLYPPALAVCLLLLTVTADAGARITHGTNYLTDRMPPAIGRFLGISPSLPPPKPQAPGLDRAIAFSDVVEPILRERCVGCHGPAKSNGGLRLDTWEFLAKGGKHGSAVKPGEPAARLLVQRIGLPADEKEHMPPSGKPQLADDDVALIEWWVGAGAPRDKAVSALDPAPSVADVLSARLGGQPAESLPGRAASSPKPPLISEKTGALIRPLAADGPWIDVNARAAGAAFGDRELAELAPVAPAIEWLDLGGTSVTDAGLAELGAMRRLERLPPRPNENRGRRARPSLRP